MVDEGGVLEEGVVDGDDFTGKGRVGIGGGFGRFENGGFFAKMEGLPKRRELYIDDFAQLFLGEVGHADGGGIAFKGHPFMGWGEAHASLHP